MWNVCGLLKQSVLLFLCAIFLSACNPLVTKTSIDSNFLAGSTAASIPAAPRYGSGLFNSPMYSTSGAGIENIGIADLNGDGFKDVVVPQPATSNVRVFLSKGDGSFHAAADYTAGLNAMYVSIADLNADTRPDLVVSNTGTVTVSVFLNIGNGAFGTKTDYTAQSNPRASALADFDGDGALDLAVANTGSAIVSTFPGLKTGGVPNGQFGAKLNLPAGNFPYHLIAKDFNNDGFIDLADTNHNATNMGIFLGNGNGTFQAMVPYTTAANPLGIESADLNGDNIPDIAVTNYVGNVVSIFIGNGNGTFQAKVDYAAGANPWSISLKDMNADGATDIVVSYESTTYISVFNGNKTGPTPNGTFAARIDTSLHVPQSRAMNVADIDNDGKFDAVLAENLTPFYMYALKGDGASSFKAFGQTYYNAQLQPDGIVMKDFNADNVLDFAVCNYNSSTFSVFIGNKTNGVGNGTFAAPAHYNTGGGTVSRDILTGDFNEDGTTDIAVISGAFSAADGLSIHLGNKTAGVANGTFGAVTFYAFVANSAPYGGTVLDFNNDGHQDIAVVNRNTSDVILMQGSGTGTFANVGSLAVLGQSQHIVSGDFNSDGKQDLAVAQTSASQMGIFLGNGNGTFQARVDYATAATMLWMVVGYIDSDSRLDILCANENLSGSISFFKGNGDGTFQAKSDFATDPYPLKFAVADIDLDGVLDLAIPSWTQGFSVMLGYGNGTFKPKQAYHGPLQSYAIAVGDLNGDGYPDIVDTAFLSSGETRIILQQ